MSMALALEYTAVWFRQKYNWEPHQCGVTINAEPSFDAGKFFIGIDDAGVEAGNSTTDSLKETLSINIGIWRRPEHFQSDRRGLMKHPVDKYLAGAWTLHKLERMVLVCGPHQNQYGTGLHQHGLHQNWSFVSGINTYFSLPTTTPNEANGNGAAFVMPWAYAGRSRSESLSQEKGETVESWIGYRLRFRGLMREQKIRSLSHSVA